MTNPTLNPLLSQSPDDKSSLFSAMAAMFRSFGLDFEKLMPAQIVSYDSSNNWATVKPLIQVVTTNNNTISRNAYAQIQCLSLGAGGFHIHFPIAPGDLGWIFAADRDVTLFQQQLADSAPNTGRIHKFSDGMFIPDVFRKYTLNGADSGNLVIQTVDSNTRISISAGGVITLTAPTKVLLATPLTECTANLIVDGNVTVTGTTTLTGAASANGGFTSASGQSCTLPTSTTIGGITVSTHGHTQTAVPGARTSGGMTS